MNTVFLVYETVDYNISVIKGFFKKNDAEHFVKQMEKHNHELVNSNCPYLGVNHTTYEEEYIDLILELEEGGTNKLSKLNLTKENLEEINKWDYEVDYLLYNAPSYIIVELEIL